jgi:hypothetical protein
MSSDWLVTLAPLIGLAADVVVQIAGAHATRRMGPSIIAGVLCGLAATAICAGLYLAAPSLADAVATWVVSVLTYLALAFGYWGFLNLNITSLRIRMLREILNAPDGISRAALDASYTNEELLERRLERLERSRQISCVDGRYRLESNTLLFLARLLMFLRILLLPERARPDSGA